MLYNEGGLARADLDGIIVQLNQSPMSVLGKGSPIDLVRAIGSGDVH
jgi:hypothetical protein